MSAQTDWDTFAEGAGLNQQNINPAFVKQMRRAFICGQLANHKFIKEIGQSADEATVINMIRNRVLELTQMSITGMSADSRS